MGWVKRAGAILGVLALGYFWWLMLRITLQYLPPRDDAGFLAIKQDYIGILGWKIAFFIHVFSSLFALAAGFTQFWRGILKKYRGIHRWMGRIYVMDVLLITGPASFIMALYANGGLSSRMAFTTLAVLWIYTTAMAYREVMRRNFARHREWMIRSYALTLSALTLRAWKLGLVMLMHPHPMDVYRVVAWLGWVPNLLLAEMIIRKSRIAGNARKSEAVEREPTGIARAAGEDGFVATRR